MKRTIYLETIAPAEAVRKTIRALNREELVREEMIVSHETSGRVLSRGVHARYSSPTFHSAAMDGYAVRARDTFAAREGFPVRLRVVERDPVEFIESVKSVESGMELQAIAVNTGHPMPEQCDAVIMIEQVMREGKDILIESPVYPWQHVRRIGEDIVATELLFSRNHRVRPWDVGALLSGGIWEVPVWERIRVRIIPTGDEVLDFSERPNPDRGQVVESNSQMLAALARELGCEIERVKPVRDDPEALHAALCASLDSGNHLTIFCAGSSAGSKDFTRATIEKEGEILVHGISAMPGKPSILGHCHGRLVAGAPGYPVSALVCFKELLEPLICWLSYQERPVTVEVPVELTRTVPSRPGVEEHVQVSIGRVGEKLVATPLGRGAGSLSTVTRAQGEIRIPESSEGLAEGSETKAELSVTKQELDRILVCVGSHDNTLDVLADELMGQSEGQSNGKTEVFQPIQLVSTHVGSMGGLTALRNGSCHMSGMHLFDPETHDFNFPFIRRFLEGVPVTVINLAIRHQGLIVPSGNPLGIQGIEDLSRVRFINRQRGAGTRILLDWKLRQAGLRGDDIRGYGTEEATHMAVAVHVLTGAADCGMGIYAAAKALGLEFVPLALERYDLVIPTCYLEDPRIVAIRKLLASDAFRMHIEAQGGYDTPLTGQIMEESKNTL